jgi:hypothetical protein
MFGLFLQPISDKWTKKETFTELRPFFLLPTRRRKVLLKNAKYFRHIIQFARTHVGDLVYVYLLQCHQ